MRKLLGCFLILTLSACASLKPVRNPDDANDRVKFSMDARFSVNYVEDTKNKNLTGKMQWEESNRATDVVLALTEFLRQQKVVGAYLEFFGPGAASTSGSRVLAAGPHPPITAPAPTAPAIRRRARSFFIR